ncbi:GGDEF domain-containing protein [Sulfurospirillum sp. T05]|uniref:diguanylate cyclase n=1 Tax=Sulfurospirillum tamanense TaxID=2813362 RepID=A0ABS2WTQ4_9BACT|nr:GGDEF domain-containing protein [Sulfurospirillum tamanensis]MBN2965039.1 GGDEF domain-containing protein [Sulfurospirillum tamanensis]
MPSLLTLPLFALSLCLLLFFGQPFFLWFDGLLEGQLSVLAMLLPLLSLFFSLHFGRAKPMLLSFLLFCGQGAILFYEPLGLTKEAAIQTFFLLLPVAFLLLGLMSEKGVFGKPSLPRYGVTLALCLVGYFLARSNTLGITIATPIFKTPLPFEPLSQIALVLYGVGVVFLLLYGLLESKQAEKSLAWALVVGGLPALGASSLPALYLGGASLIFLVALSNDAYRMAFIDTLTGIPSRRAMEEYFERLSPPFTIAMTDIDHFKNFNDTYGHDVGDDVLRKVATTLKGVKGGGKAFRYGGEEFALVFAGKQVKECKLYLEEVREAIANQGFQIRGNDRAPKKSPAKSGTTVSLTISIGACDHSWGKDIPAIVKKADTLLYQAKKAGRNCVKLASTKAS